MLKDDEIRDLWKRFDPLPQGWDKWHKDFLDFVTWIQRMPVQELRTEHVQRKLLNARAITSVGYGDGIRIDALVTDAEYVTNIVDIRASVLPHDVEARANHLQRAYEVLIGIARNRGVKPMPYAKLRRLLGALFPHEMTCVLNYDANRRTADLLLGDNRDLGAYGQVRMRARLREAIGEEHDLAEDVRRSMFCWWLHDHYEEIRSGSLTPTAATPAPSATSFFQVVTSRFQTAAGTSWPCVILEADPWDDGGYRTQFRAYYATGERDHLSLGTVKILRRGAKLPALPAGFSTLSDDCCSLGTSLDYYEHLRVLGLDVAQKILRGLRDAAYHSEIADAFRDDPGFSGSLLRFSTAELALKEGRERFLGASPADHPPRFTFKCKLDGFEEPHEIAIAFSKEQKKLGRMMGIVGKNGTGKTRLFAALAHALSGRGNDNGSLDAADERRRVVALSFSAFDQFDRPSNDDGLYVYHGLRRHVSEASRDNTIKDKRLVDVVDMNHAYARLEQSLREIQRRGKSHEERWTKLVEQTGLFQQAEALDDARSTEAEAPPYPRRPFGGDASAGVSEFLEDLRSAGAGQQLLVFVVTAFVESVRPGTVVLFDEPETHFHPNVLSTLLRLLYHALEETDAYAILATHSPIVVQEIPKQFLRILRMKGRKPIVDDYSRESFGENLSEIVRYVFDVDEIDKSYVTILQNLAKKLPREEVEKLFDGDLGLGARMVLREAYRQKEKAQ